MNLWTSVTDMINKTVENQTFPFELVAQRLNILVNTGSKEHAERNRIFYSLKIKCHLIISTRTHVNITVETNIWLMCVCVSVLLVFATSYYYHCYHFKIEFFLYTYT